MDVSFAASLLLQLGETLLGYRNKKAVSWSFWGHFVTKVLVIVVVVCYGTMFHTEHSTHWFLWFLFSSIEPSFHRHRGKNWRGFRISRLTAALAAPTSEDFAVSLEPVSQNLGSARRLFSRSFGANVLEHRLCKTVWCPGARGRFLRLRSNIYLPTFEDVFKRTVSNRLPVCGPRSSNSVLPSILQTSGSASGRF